MAAGGGRIWWRFVVKDSCRNGLCRCVQCLAGVASSLFGFAETVALALRFEDVAAVR